MEPFYSSDELIGREVHTVKTTKMICNSCKRSFVILKGGEYDCGECEHCGCTSFIMGDGRPWGHRHRAWNDYVRYSLHLDEQNRITEESLDEWPDSENLAEWFTLKAN